MKTVELLYVNAKDAAQTIPTQNAAEDFIEAGNRAQPRTRIIMGLT